VKSITLSILISTSAIGQVFAAGFEVLAPHRATYEVKLIEASEQSGIDAMDGRIVYELKGNACDGVSISYRFVTRINANRELFVTDQRSTSYESPNGKEFSFTTKSFVNDQPDQDVRGSAVLTPDGLKVVHTGNNPVELEMPSALFTSAHIIDVLENAEKGEAFVSHAVFDGAGDADKVLRSTSVIGKGKVMPEPLEGEKGDHLEKLIERKSWPITMSYFNFNQDASSEGLPIYQASFLLFDNGVTRDLTMKYEDYSLKATLSEFEFLDTESCG
jgi:hypothetical protein